MSNNAAQVVSRTTTSVTLNVYSNHADGPEAEDAPFYMTVYGRLFDPNVVPSYSASAVTFNGSSYLYRNSQLSGVANTSSGLMSLWVQTAGTGNANPQVFGATVGTNILLPQQIMTQAGFRKGFFVDNRGGSGMSFFTPPDSLPLNTWLNVIVSWDSNFGAGAKLVSIAINDANQTLTQNSNLGSAYPWLYTSVLSWAVAAAGDSATSTEHVLSSSKYTGNMADFQFWAGVYRDMGTETNRRLFIDNGGKPVDPSVAATALGTQTLLFSGTSSSFGTNQGTGGAFTLTGTLSDAPTSPSD